MDEGGNIEYELDPVYASEFSRVFAACFLVRRLAGRSLEHRHSPSSGLSSCEVPMLVQRDPHTGITTTTNEEVRWKQMFWFLKDYIQDRMVWLVWVEEFAPWHDVYMLGRLNCSDSILRAVPLQGMMILA